LTCYRPPSHPPSIEREAGDPVRSRLTSDAQRIRSCLLTDSTRSDCANANIAHFWSPADPASDGRRRVIARSAALQACLAQSYRFTQATMPASARVVPSVRRKHTRYHLCRRRRSETTLQARINGVGERKESPFDVVFASHERHPRVCMMGIIAACIPPCSRQTRSHPPGCAFRSLRRDSR
jgi:hypothetical protein